MLRKNITLKFGNYIVVWDNPTSTGIPENNEISWTLNCMYFEGKKREPRK